jgi:hypothetical protein
MNKKTVLFVLLTSILSFFLVPVSAFEELDEVSLKPMAKPSPLPIVAGDKWYWLKSGFFNTDKKDHIIYYESVNETNHSARESNGCSWTRMTGKFAPTLEWYDCYQDRSGAQEIINTMGNPWPLSENTEFQYEFTGKWDDGFGAKWHQTRKCKVDKQVRVNVPAGEFDTYKLICEDPSLKWTYWISPKLGHRVAYELENKSFLSRSYMAELVKVVNP